MQDFYHNKTILITGAASGIGKRFAEKVSETAENTTLILWDRNPDTLRQIQAGLSDRSKIYIADVDVSDYSIIEKEAKLLAANSVTPDIIINCAGIVVGKMFHEHTLKDIQNTININTTGSMLIVRAFITEMIDRGSGHIVNLGSASGFIGNPRMSVYASSKWAIHGWSESLRLEMKKLKTGINVTTVIPSYIKTGMFDGVKPPFLVPLLETDQIVNKMISGIAMGKHKIQAPFMVRFVPLIKALLPDTAFDWAAGNLLGVYRSMDSFTGRNKMNR